MWTLCTAIPSDAMQLFETAMDFHFIPVLRDFLLAHNGGRARQCNLTTNVKERRIAGILDFSRGGNAWDINRRMRKILGIKCVVIGTDRSDNFLCVCRDGRKQSFCIWNHVTSELEVCTEDITMTLMQWQAGGENNG